jgi:hypothetical protein
MSHWWIVDTKEKAEFFIAFIKDQLQSNNIITYSLKEENRTQRQNSAMHLWFRQIADELNDCGCWVKHPFSESLEIPFTDVLVKEMLYKPIIKSMYQKDSTGKLTVKEVGESAEVLIKWLAENKSVYIPFPQSLKDAFQ